MRMASALYSDFLKRVIKSYGIGHSRIILCNHRSNPIQDLVSKIQANRWILNKTIKMNGHIGLVTCILYTQVFRFSLTCRGISNVLNCTTSNTIPWSSLNPQMTLGTPIKNDWAQNFNSLYLHARMF